MAEINSLFAGDSGGLSVAKIFWKNFFIIRISVSIYAFAYMSLFLYARPRKVYITYLVKADIDT